MGMYGIAYGKDLGDKLESGKNFEKSVMTKQAKRQLCGRHRLLAYLLSWNQKFHAQQKSGNGKE